MPAEGTHEIGRRGALEAKHTLERLLGDKIRLPFNAYDHPSKLSFDPGSTLGVPRFNFDLGGSLERVDSARFGGTEAVEVFVEVKNHATGDSLLTEFANFLQRAAVVASTPGHADTWFLFVSNVPFGTSKGVDLSNGKYLRECCANWHDQLRHTAVGLESRIAVVIATESFVRLLDRWSRDV